MFTSLMVSLGLGAASGHRAAIAALVVGAMHYTEWFELGPQWTWLASPPVLGILAVLVVVEFLADRSPDVAELVELAAWLPKAVMGFLLVAAATGELHPSMGSLMASGLLGAAVAAGTEKLRSSSRKQTRELAQTGVGTPDKLAGYTETVASAGLVAAALMAPWTVLLVLLAAVGAASALWLVARASRGMVSRAFGFRTGGEKGTVTTTDAGEPA